MLMQVTACVDAWFLVEQNAESKSGMMREVFW